MKRYPITKSTTPENAFHNQDGAPINADNKKDMSVRTLHSDTATRNKSSRRGGLQSRSGIKIKDWRRSTYKSFELSYWRHQDSIVTKPKTDDMNE